MDIWAWVNAARKDLAENGHPELAQMLLRLPNDAIEGRIDRVEAAVPVVVAQARALKSPWLEVFARHWQLQLHCAERGAASLPEAVDLFELAHRDETSGCPQSVCVTQDLAIAYGATDGPGYAEERIAVSVETLGRIDPSWGCFDCLTNEWANALIDAGRSDEAVDVVEAQARKVLEAGEQLDNHFRRNQAQIIIDAGRWAEGLPIVESLLGERESQASPHAMIGLRLLQAEALSRLGRGLEAVGHLPTPDEVERHGSRSRWATIVELLVEQGAMDNDAGLGIVLRRFVDTYRASGAHRRRFDVAAVHGRLAVRRGAAWIADEALAEMREAQAALRVDAGAAATLAALEAAVAQVPASELPVPAAELVGYLDALPESEHDLEREISWLRAANAERVDRDVAHRLAMLLSFADRAPAALDVLRDALAHLPDDEPLAGALIEVALQSDDVALDEALELLERTQPPMSWWLRARRAYAEGDDTSCVAWCERIVDDDPGVVNTRRLWAAAARRLGDHATAVARLAEVVARADPGGDDWELMVDATAVGRWDLVRASCARLGIELDAVENADAPIDERWGPVAIRFMLDDGTEQTVSAMRTGPVTAEVVSIAPNAATQHAGDLVLFRANPLEQPPEDEAARARFRFTYPAVEVLRPGGFTGWVLDGVYPGDDAWPEFRAAVLDRGWLVWIYSDDDYRVTNPFGGDLPGIYGRIATPQGVTAADADRVLHELTESWEHPVVWPDLADAAGHDVERHQRIIAAYGL